MRYLVLATDYDGTLATKGVVAQHVVDALKNIKESGRKLLLVTGRELDELKALFPEHVLFDKIVAENGALIYDPFTTEEKKLGELPPEEFITALVKKGVGPISTGRVIVATWEPHHATVLETIKEFGIERQVIFNKGAVMILPTGINKAKGLDFALNEMHLSIHNAVSIGDAENDNAMLQASECSFAVANALDAVKQQADVTTEKDHGDGVVELIESLHATDLNQLDSKLNRHYLELGRDMDDEPFVISPYRPGILLSGTSGAGKTTFTISFLEALTEKKYQYCLIDPEGDYTEIKGAVILGNEKQLPVMDEIKNLLKNPQQNIVICTLAIPLADRPAFFNTFLSTVTEIRKTYGHPHWLIFDEAHHLMPANTETTFFSIPVHFNNFLMITTSPEHMNQTVFTHLNTLIVIGQEPSEMVKHFAAKKEIKATRISSEPLPKGQALVWDVEKKKPFPLSIRKPQQLLQRHKKKYATGDMLDNSFIFRGPENKLKLKANNLMMFVQIADGVDEETWSYHLKKHDYSNWVDDRVHDEEMADLIKEIEDDNTLDSDASRQQVIDLINGRYTG